MAQASRARRSSSNKPKVSKSGAAQSKGRRGSGGPKPDSSLPTVEARLSRRSVRLNIPHPPADSLARDRLVNFVNENIYRKLVLISAAAGYGKTALLAEFASETDYAVAWLQMAETDRDLVALINDLVSALKARFPSFESELPQLAAQPGTAPADLAIVLAREIERGLDEYLVLVLDDFHLVDGVPAVLEFFNSFLDNLPDQAHLVIAGRALPALKFAKLAAKQQIAGLSEEHLRFRPDEVQALLRLRNRVEMPPAAAETLVANTEGWITGILLTTHLMWQGLMANLIEGRQSENQLFDYLASEVLDQQAEPLRQFLLDSSVLPEMEPATCDEVLGRTDSADLLRQAESRRLFISAVGEDFRAYQYHNLFRDFLQNRLRAQDPARLKSIQARAAEWYAANGMPEAAVTYYVQAGALSKAAQLAEAQARAMYFAGRRTTLSRWAEQLAPVAREAPRLHVLLATAEIEAGETRKADQALAVASAAFTERGDEAGLVEVDLRRAWSLIRRNEYPAALEMAQAAAKKAKQLGVPAAQALALRYTGRCLVDLGRATEAEPALREAADLLSETGQLYDLALTLHDLAQAYRLRGQTTLASEAQRKALALMRSEGLIGPLAALLNDIGWDLHMLGQYEGALATYAEGMDWARRGGNSLSELTITIGRADVLADLGETTQAGVLFRQALDTAEAGNAWTLTVYLQCALARQDRRAGNYAGAMEWLRRADRTADGRYLSVPMANIAVLRGIVLTETGQLDKGRQLLLETRAVLEPAESPVDLAQCLFYAACAEFRLGQTAEAANLVEQSLTVAEQVGYDQMLLTEAERAADLLEACRERPELEPRASGLLARARGLSLVRASLAERGVLPPAPDVSRSPWQGLEVRFLGTGQVFRNGVEIARAGWGSQRPRELFFWLMDSAPVSRDRTLATFWPEMSQARAVANLYQTLYRLRRAVGEEVVVMDGNGFHLPPKLNVRSDVAQFEAVARAALGFSHNDLRRLGALEAAIALYTGEYLLDISADWTVARRRTLADQFVRLLSEYADELLSLTRYGDARVTLARALALEPLRDDLHGRMLVCLAALGRRHEVVDHYRRYRETLRGELGLDPPPEIRSLYARLIE